MCMTEHLDLDYPYEDVSFDLDAEAYVREMRRLQDVYRDRLELRIGVEIGLQPHLGDAYRTWLSDKSFDFLIGSTHLVDRFDPYYPDFWSSYDAASGVLQFNATSNTVIDIPAYVRALQNCGIFSDVDYTGYQSTNGRGQPAGYALNLRCTLAAPE